MNRLTLPGLLILLVFLVGCGGSSTTPISTNPLVTLSAVDLNPSTVLGGTESTATVTLSSAAPAGGAIVVLSCNNNIAVQMQYSVTIPAGARSMRFIIGTAPVASITSVIVTANYGKSQNAILTVNPPSISSLTLDVNLVMGGTRATGTIVLNGSPPVQGAAVTLSSNNVAAEVPTAVVIPAGTNTATFPVSTASVSSVTIATLTGSYNGTQTTILTIDPPSVLVSAWPFEASAGDSAFLLTVKGSRFLPTSTIQWDGNPRSTTYVNSNELTALISASDIANPGVANIDVSNLLPAGITPSLRFEIKGPISVSRFLYVASTNSSNIFAYRIDPGTGTLTQINGSPFPNPGPFGMVVDRFGSFLYVVNTDPECLNISSCNVSSFQIAPSGELVPVDGSPFAAIGNDVEIDRSGNLLIASTRLANQTRINSYLLDAKSGAPTPLNTFAAGEGRDFKADVSNHFLYGPAGNILDPNGSGGVAGYAIDPTNGAINVLEGSPFGGLYTGDIVLDTLGIYLFASTAYAYPYDLQRISVFRQDASTGALTVLSQMTIPNYYLVVHPSGKYLYASSPTNSNRGNVLGFHVDRNNGSLTPLPGSPYATSGSYPRSLVIDATGRFLYLVNVFGDTSDASEVDGYAIDPATGSLTFVPGSPFSAGPYSFSMVISP